MKRTSLNQTKLSTGQLLELYKHGRTYTVLLCGLGNLDAPDVHPGLCKADAERIYADYMQSDVMEN